MDTQSAGAISDINHVGEARVRVIASDNNWIESDAVAQLKKTAELPGVKVAVGLPDLHPGKGQPIGAAFITGKLIYPHLVGSDIGCGMAFYAFDKSRRKLKLNKLEKQLRNFESMEWEVTEFVDSLPNLSEFDFPNALNKKLGTVGGGNHFFECQEVTEVFDEPVFNELNVPNNALFLLVHSGSRGIGQHILVDHIDNYGSAGIQGLSADTYLKRHNFANDWAVINRDAVARKVSVLTGSDLNPILDVSHNHVIKLSQPDCLALGLDPSVDHWIHRKGARACSH